MSLVTGKGVNPQKADKALAKSAHELAPGEVVWYFAKCNNIKPMTDAVVITNARVMGLSTGLSYKFKVLHSDIIGLDTDAKRGTVTVATRTGDTMTFKAVAPEDIPAVVHYIEYGRAHGVPADVTRALLAHTAPGSGARHRNDVAPQTADDKARAKYEKREQKAVAKARRKADQEARAQDELERYGEKIAEEFFGMRTVRIYSNGYVRVSLPMLGANAQFERLLSIESSADVSKKSGLGRGAAAVVTGGYNLLSSNKRGDVYLTISTDVSTHVLHEDPPTAMNLKQVKRLEAAGSSVIGRSQRLPSAPALAEAAEQSTETASDIRSRLQELTNLRNEDLISETEYTRLRIKLLDEV